MKTNFATTALILASALIAGTSAFAGVTREQVTAELASATRSGDIMASGESGLKLNELYPNRYPAKQVQAGLTRDQVNAELAEAIQTGGFMVGGEVSPKCNELHPSMHRSI